MTWELYFDFMLPQNYICITCYYGTTFIECVELYFSDVLHACLTINTGSIVILIFGVVFFLVQNTSKA